MEKGQGPPSSPPYPGPPLNNSGAAYFTQDGSAAAQVVVVTLPTDVPGQMMCQYCQNSVITQTSVQSGGFTWLMCCLIGIFLCWPCCFMPFCCTSCKDVHHTCPICDKVIHIHKRI